MHTLRLAPLLTTLVGCSPTNYHRCETPGKVSFTMRGTDWSDIGDNIIHLRIFVTKDDWVEQSEALDLTADGKLKLTFQCGLDDGEDYGVAMYINTNDKGGCQRADDAWLYDLGSTSNDVLLEVSPDDPTDSDACDQF
jgi:hypothetical protein